MDEYYVNQSIHLNSSRYFTHYVFVILSQGVALLKASLESNTALTGVSLGYLLPCRSTLVLHEYCH